jgi:hypothetical protein
LIRRQSVFVAVHKVWGKALHQLLR